MSFASLQSRQRSEMRGQTTTRMPLRSSGLGLLSFLSRHVLSAQRPSLSPYPQVSHDLYGRREDQRAKRRLRDRLHRPLDQHGMDHTSYDDDDREGHMDDTSRSQSQSQS